MDALRGRGPAAYTGEPLSFLLIEVQSNRLWIRGATPLQDNSERYVAAGTEYCYVLEAHEAEKLLRALTRHSRDRPERILADNFEFSRPAPENLRSCFLFRLKYPRQGFDERIPDR